MNFITINELSCLVDKSVRWVYLHAQEFGGFKIGGSWFFTRDGVENAIQTRTEMASRCKVAREKITGSFFDKKRSNRMGDKHKKDSQKEIEDLARKHGFSDLLSKVS